MHDKSAHTSTSQQNNVSVSTAAERYQQAWLGDVAPDLEAYCKNCGPLTAPELSAIAQVDQRERWKRGERILAETYLQRFPTVASDPAAAFDLAYAEYLLRDHLGERPTVAEYVQRFPEQAPQLAARIASHGAPAEVAADSSKVIGADGPADTLAATTVPTRSGESREISGKFGRYNILRLLGRGGMGEVYLAYDTLLHREVALKVPRTVGELDPDSVERFYREARTAAKLSHPHLCPVYDVGEINGLLFLAMPYIRGESLAAVLKRGPLPPSRAAALVVKLALAVEEAHRGGILHRDLKPGNVMLNERGEPVVMDFGLARLQEQQQDLRLTATGTLLGTPAYASPEQLMGNGVLTPASDIYSLGVILFEMLTGRAPFEGSLASVMKQVLVDPPPRPSSLAPGIDRGLESICLRALEKSPAERFPTMAALAEAISQAGQFVTADIVAAPPLPPQAAATPLAKPLPSTPQVSSNRFAVRGCLAALLCGLLVCGGLCSAGAYLLPDIAKRIQSDLQSDPNWDDLARFWHAPANMPPDFNQLDLPGYRFMSQNEVAEIPSFGLKLPSRHSAFQHVDGDLELFVARATELEKEAVYRKVNEIIRQHDDDLGDKNFGHEVAELGLPDYPYYPDKSRSGGPSLRYISYRHRQDYKVPGDAAVFWWDEGWLFIARSQSEADPRFFLREILAASHARTEPQPVHKQP